MPYSAPLPCNSPVRATASGVGAPEGSKYRTVNTTEWNGLPNPPNRYNIFHGGPSQPNGQTFQWSEPCQQWILTHAIDIVEASGQLTCWMWDPIVGAWFWCDDNEHQCECPDFEEQYSDLFPDEEEELPLGTANGVVQNITWETREQFEAWMQEHFPEWPVQPRFNNLNLNQSWFATTLGNLDCNTGRMAEVEPVDAGPVESLIPDFYGLGITANGAVSLEHLNIVITNQVNTVLVLRDLYKDQMAMAQWMNLMNAALIQRIEQLTQLVQILGTPLHGEGWEDRLQSSPATRGTG